MTEPFKFGKYTMRQATADDRELIEQWIADDPAHKADGVPPEFFFEEEMGVGCYLVSDKDGPIFFTRTSNTVRLDTQFGPHTSRDERERNREALIDGMDWLAAMCAAKGITEISFETNNPMLARLAVHKMGCRRSCNEMIRSLEPERHHLTIGDMARRMHQVPSLGAK
jgi:hypothetical protein